MEKPFTVTLPGSIRGLIDERVAAGGFADAADYLTRVAILEKVERSVQTFEEELVKRLRAEPAPVSEAIVERVKDEIGNRRLAELKADIAEGVEQADRGESVPLDIDAIIAEGRRRLRAERSVRREAVR